MPIISLDEVPVLVLRHPRHVLLARDPKDVLPSTTHSVLNLVKVNHLWQLLTFSPREITDQMLSLARSSSQPEVAPVIEEISGALVPHGFKLRENTPFAIRVERKPPVFIKALSESTKTFTPFYAEGTFYWNRWQGFQAQAKLTKGVTEKTRLVFRSESLKLGYDITR